MPVRLEIPFEILIFLVNFCFLSVFVANKDLFMKSPCCFVAYYINDVIRTVTVKCVCTRNL